MAKTLRITFSGICTLAPGCPATPTGPQPTTVWVIMPASREAGVEIDGTTPRAVSRHRPFIYVPRAHVAPSTAARVADFTVTDKKLLTDCDVYLMDRVHVVVTPQATNPLRYNVTNGTIGTSPTQPGSAPKADIRWLADMRTILPLTAQLQVTCDPRQTAMPNLAQAVAGVVEIQRGTLLANFPCANAGPQMFTPPVPPLQRLFACEFINELEYPDTTTEVTLAITSLDGNIEPDVTVTWGTKNIVDIRIGHDTLDEIVEVATYRCLGPASAGTADNDFELHYRILANVPASGRPVPVATGGQTRHNGCLSQMVG